MLYFLVAFCLFALPVNAEDKIVTTYHGNGNQSFRPFVVEDHWEMQWSASGTQFFLTIIKERLEPLENIGKISSMEEMTAAVGMILDQLPQVLAMEPGASTHYQSKGGTYSVAVRANGPWSIKVVQIHGP